MITIEIKRQPNESNMSVMRRFSKRLQTSGVIRRVKNLKSRSRAQSHYKIKKATLKKLERRTAYERLKKLGKVGLTNAPYHKTQS